MSSIDQNGSQPPVSSQSSSISASATGGTDKSTEICRNFVWGTCNKGAACKFRHELDFEKVKKTLKFCHDYQNRSGCTREGCGYLHTTKDEQNLFYATGKLPKVLAERHANMSAETIPQIAMFIQETLMRGSPPSSMAAQSAPSVVGPMHQPVIGPMHQPVIGPMQPIVAGPMYPPGLAVRPVQPPMMPIPPPGPPPGPPPQPSGPSGPPGPSTVPSLPVIPMQHLPPPPPPPTQSSVTISQPKPPIYTAPSHPGIAFPMNQPPPVIPPKFDASKPPPPLLQVQNGSLKRTATSELEAGPSKARKLDESNIDDTQCDSCQQRQIRIDAYDKETENMCARRECQLLIYKKKVEEYQKKKELLKSLVSPEVFRLLEDVEEEEQLYEALNQNQPTNITNDRELRMQVLEYFMKNQKNTDSNQPSSPRIEDRLTSLFSAVRPNTVTNPKPDILSFLELLRGVNKPEKEEKAIDESKTTANSNNNTIQNVYSGPIIITQHTNNDLSSKRLHISANKSDSTVNKVQGPVAGPQTRSSTAAAVTHHYPVYSGPPPMKRPYVPHTSAPPLPSTSMATNSRHNGVLSTQSLVSNPVPCIVPPPPPNTNQSYPSYNTGSYPPPTHYYNPYQ